MLTRLTAPDIKRWDLDGDGQWHPAGSVDVQSELLVTAREQSAVT